MTALWARTVCLLPSAGRTSSATRLHGFGFQLAIEMFVVMSFEHLKMLGSQDFLLIEDGLDLMQVTFVGPVHGVSAVF